MSLFELGLSSERKASHDCIGIEMKIQDNNEIQEVNTSFETRNYDQRLLNLDFERNYSFTINTQHFEMYSRLT